MKKIILVLVALTLSVFAEMVTGLEVAAGKSYSDSDARIKSGLIKIGNDSETARLFVFGGVDHYNDNEGSCKYYGIELDKKFDEFYVGFGMAFGKKNMKGFELSNRDLILKVGHTWYSESSSIDTGVKFIDRAFKDADIRHRLGLVFVGYNFNL